MKRGIKATIASASALTLATFVPLGTALAQEGDAVISNTETVNVALDPSGNVDVARVYDQIAIQGSGTVDYANPVSTVGLRNLDSFGGFTVEGDSIVEETDVDGQVRRRAVSDFDLDLPVTVSVVYRLDGQEIDPDDLVGKSGEVEVTYTIENMTGSEEQITVADGQGNEVTKTAMIYDPFAGSMSFTLPPNYTDVVSDSGFLPAGDGRGGTLMNLSVTLVPGLTEQVLEASYTAQVKDAVIPPASLAFLPLVVRENTSTAPQLEALQGGAETGQELASNAVLLDESVLALADGAGTLVNGILLLDAGAAELSDGLVNTAAPGSAELAAGAGELAAGLNGTAVPGSQELAAGAGELAAGLNGTAVPGSAALADGADQVAGGVEKLDAGLSELYAAVDKLPASVKKNLENNPSYQALLGGLDQLILGLRAAGTTDCAKGLVGIDPTNCGAMDAVELVAGLLGDASESGGDIDLLIGAAKGAYAQSQSPALPNPPFATCPTDTDLGVTVPVPPVLPPSVLTGSLGLPANDVCVLIANVVYGLGLPAKVVTPTDPGGLKAQTEAASAALVEVYEGVDAEAIAGLEQVKAGIPQLIDGILAGIEAQLIGALGKPTAGCDPTETLRCASAALTAGSSDVADGANDLAGGLAGAGDGASQVADGAGQLATGLVDAGDGANQVADGAGQLADGLGDAAAGSVQLSDGLGDAAEAAPALPAGAQRLSAEGTSLLIEAGDDTALSFGERVAVLEASADRTADGGLPFGAPQDAIVAAAYRYDLAAATGATAQNTGRLVAGFAIAGAAAVGVGVLARRRTA